MNTRLFINILVLMFAMNVGELQAQTALKKGLEQATFGAGCFWCVEAVYEELDGVTQVASGFAGGSTTNPSYAVVCEGETGHAEVVQITYDPQVISYIDLLEVFWTTHDPAEGDQQGKGGRSQYRSVILYHSEAQREQAEVSKNQLNASESLDGPVVTEVSPFTNFYVAEDYHQDYYAVNGHMPYCRHLIAPKVEKVRENFPDMLKPSN